MAGKTIAYVRVSYIDQNVDRQIEGIRVDKMFVEKASAKSRDRPQLQLLMDYIREEDTVVVHSMDRLARNLRDLKNLVDEMIKKGANVKFVKENLTFTADEDPIANLVLNLMGAFAEFEYAFARERQREGVQIAKAKGKYSKKRKRKIDESKANIIRERLKTRVSMASIAREVEISRTLMYNYLSSQEDLKHHIQKNPFEKKNKSEKDE